jgi:recombination protein RecA
MNRATQLRAHIEDCLNTRTPAALTPRQRSEPERIACKRAAIDEFLGGGLALGSITEFVGPHGSGRTTAALAYVSAVTNAGGVCAWIDAADSLDPESAAANGVALAKLLWVRCGSGSQMAPQRALEDRQGAPPSVVLSQSQQRHTGGGSPHPRSEGRDMPQAIRNLLHAHGGLYDKQVRRERRAIGTPGAPNRPLTYRSDHREEQVNSDRLPPRRGDNLSIAPRCAEVQSRRISNTPANERLAIHSSSQSDRFKTDASQWKVLDQAIRTADLLLQGGGFTVIVLDLGNVPPEFTWRIPLATWFRFRAACERTRVSLLLLTQHACARSSAEAVVRMQPGSIEAQGNVMTGMLYRASTERIRGYEASVIPIRKPPQPDRVGSKAMGQWMTETAWMEAG